MHARQKGLSMPTSTTGMDEQYSFLPLHCDMPAHSQKKFVKLTKVFFLRNREAWPRPKLSRLALFRLSLKRFIVRAETPR